MANWFDQCANADVRLDRNLTKLRLSEEMRNADRFLLIIWDLEYHNTERFGDRPGRSIRDIIEVFSSKELIRYFNKHRNQWDGTTLGQTDLKKVEDLPKCEARIEAYKYKTST